jgi:CDP-6-deoxy-D-xylo-4-hexulose-3-dehydrase
MKNFYHPLMNNNISESDVNSVINFLKTNKKRIFTQSLKVKQFEKQWSKWLGVNYSIFVNSGSSANLITLLAVKILNGTGEIIVPPLTWISDIASVIQNGFKPVFVDINPKTLCMDEEEICKKINKNTKAVFITHVQGFNGITDKLLKILIKIRKKMNNREYKRLKNNKYRNKKKNLKKMFN